MNNNTPSAPPKRMALNDVPTYLAKRGIKASRRSIFIWASKGKAGVVLRTGGMMNGRYTMDRWVDAFVREASAVSTRGR